MGQRIAIFGAGLSGQAARKLALDKGHEVEVFDQAGGGDRNSFVESELGHYDRFVFSPGFAQDHPWRRMVHSSGKSIYSEMGFAAEYWRGQVIAVTGTNGKSTLTRLLAEALQSAGKQAMVAGNIGRPLSEVAMLSDNTESAYAVCEISSFQAEICAGLNLDALIWTNFAEDHLDRYKTLEDYFTAKAGLIECLKTDAICIVGPQVMYWSKRLNQSLGQVIVASSEYNPSSSLGPNSVFTRRPYNENFALAAEYWQAEGLPEEVLYHTANNFSLDPHRLQVVAEADGVTCWDDSKATNFHAVLAALEAVPRPIIWIGGGRHKGGDLETFGRAVSKQVDVAVLYGEIAPQLFEVVSKYVKNVQIHKTFEPAVRAACQIAKELAPSNVLLSPGFSSFDQFDSYEARGKSFKSLVLGL